jgi:RNA polymerase sigma factor (sigma-70 family)
MARDPLKRHTTGRTAAASLPPFERVVELHGPAVLRFCMVQVGSARAEDCFQETMLSALRAYEGVRDAHAIRAWLFSIAARKATDAHRARARAPEPVEELESLAGTQESPRRDDALWAQVRALPDKQRQAVTLRFAGDLSHGEIAAVMQTSEAAARRSVFEGLNRLRRNGAR